MMIKKLKHKYDIPSRHKNRINTGGLRLSNCINKLDSPDIDTTELVDYIFMIFSAATNETVCQKIQSTITDPIRMKVNMFFAWLEQAELASKEYKTEMKLNVPHATRNHQIDVRNFGYQC